MEFNRNQFFLLGMLLLLLGVQFRMVDSFQLNDKVTKVLANHSQQTPTATIASLIPADAPLPHKVIHPPQWLGYSMISIGSVLILHALAMTKPAGG